MTLRLVHRRDQACSFTKALNSGGDAFIPQKCRPTPRLDRPRFAGLPRQPSLPHAHLPPPPAPSPQFLLSLSPAVPAQSKTPSTKGATTMRYLHTMLRVRNLD